MPITHGQGNPDWTRDETILALELVQRNWPKIPGKRSLEVKELSDLICRLPIHRHADRNTRFRNPDGVYLKLQNLASLHHDKASRKGLRTSRTDREVWSAYSSRPDYVRQLAEQIAMGVSLIASLPFDEAEDDFEASEGTILLRVHRFRERNRGFRSRVIRRVRKLHGELLCDACGNGPRFDSAVAHAIFEVHHLVPLCEAATVVTRLNDLALLCANCHRLIHAVMRQDERHYTLTEFRAWSKDKSMQQHAGGRTFD